MKPVNPMDALREETHATANDVARLRAELPADLSQVGRARARWPWALGLGLAAAAAALLLVPRAPEDLPVALQLGGEGEQVQVGEHVSLLVNGKGTIEGSTLSPSVQWSTGSLSVQVTPEQGIDLSVHTREGVVRVIGTAFEVSRDALGTAVRVERGQVKVSCLQQEPVSLTAGKEHSCLPTSPGGLLGRARALQGAGAEAEQVLSTVELGLASSELSPAIGGELMVLRVEQLVKLGRRDDALRGSLDYLSQPSPLRAAEVAQGVLNLANEGDCDALRVAVTVLGSAAPPAQVERSADCVTP